MRVTGLELVNFKRFTHLVIEKIPPDAKLVLVTGASGSGKTCLFDAFRLLGSGKTSLSDAEREYYGKGGLLPELAVTLSDGSRLVFPRNATVAGSPFKFMGRTSLRLVSLPPESDPALVQADADAQDTFMDADNRFQNDLLAYIQQLDNALREPVFSGRSADTLEIFRDFIRPFNQSLLNIFGADTDTTIQLAAYGNATPDRPAMLLFNKGNSRINFNFLSHGEKQVVVLLLNFIVHREQYQDAVVAIDDLDAFIPAGLQEAVAGNCECQDSRQRTAVDRFPFACVYSLCGTAGKCLYH